MTLQMLQNLAAFLEMDAWKAKDEIRVSMEHEGQRHLMTVTELETATQETCETLLLKAFSAFTGIPFN